MAKTDLIRNIIASMKTITDSMEALLVLTEGEPIRTNKNVEVKMIPLEDVRAVLAEKSREGKTSEVKELLVKFGANRLSEINPECYMELLKAAVEL